MHLPPVVYAGPSISPEEVHTHLPDAVIMPAVKRGDLYRDRMIGFSFFIILDGVFYHELAIPPRELLDVMADGAVLVGATSMGAIRAAECWPAGMRGIGTIYRLFRQGSLRSDDEVAVAFGPVKPHLISTVPLVNVRYAVSRAIRAGEIDRNLAESIVQAATNTFYADRNWRSILLQAGLEDEDGQLRKHLASYDLKRMDSVRALKASAAMLVRDPSLLDLPRKTNEPFAPNQFTRERSHDPYGPSGAGESRPGIWHWLLASGRVRRYSSLAPWYERFVTPTGGQGDVDATVLAGSEFPEAAWQSLQDLGEIESLAYRYRAISKAAREARDKDLKPDPGHRYEAGVEIAIEHGFPEWGALQMEVAGHDPLWRWIEEYRHTLSLAKCMRDSLFSPSGS